MWKTKATAQ